MAAFRLEILIARAILTAMLLCAVLVLFEFYLRKEVTYVVQAEIAKAGGFLEANPEFLVQQTARGRRLVPNAQVVIKNHYMSQQDVKIDTNSLGFRGPAIPKEKTRHELRIQFLGDSVTVADYLPQEQIFTELVGKQLSQALHPRKVLSINAAIGNVGTEEEVNILEDTLADVQPDLVILNFYLNDSRPPWGFSGEIGDRGWIRRHSLIVDTIYRQLEERRWMAKQGIERFAWVEAVDKLDWRKNSADLKSLAKLAKYDWGAAWEEESWPKVEVQMQRLQKLAARAGARVAVVAFPVRYQVEADYIDDAPQRALEQQAKKMGFAFYDLLPALREAREEKLFLDHCHPSARGNEIIAKRIGEFIEMGLNPSSKAIIRLEAE